jgi:hypothetical protein
VNPVEIWEGVDTREETGRNRLTKLAIHVLSVVANSAGCERAFSHMGLVHTAIRSRLSVEKVRKATIVGMDIKRMHKEAGLLRVQARRNFTSSSGSEPEAGEQDTEPALADDLGEINDPLDFDQLSEQLIAGALSASGDKDVGDTDDDELPSTVTPPAPPLTITIPPLNLATRSAPSQHSTAVKVSIPLKILFKYPTDRDPPSDGMNTFWKGGIRNLEKELEAYELLLSRLSGSGDSEENTADEVNPEIPNNTSMDIN